MLRDMAASTSSRKTTAPRKKAGAKKTGEKEAGAVKKATTPRATARRESAARKAPAVGPRKTARRVPAAGGRKNSSQASDYVRTEMNEMHEGTLRSGRSGKKVTDSKQAIAIGLSEARRDGKKVPPRPPREGKKKR